MRRATAATSLARTARKGDDAIARLIFINALREVLGLSPIEERTREFMQRAKRSA